MSLLPSSTLEIDTEQAGNIQILGIDERNTDAVFETLSSATTRNLLVSINDEPGTPSELADRLETSIQTISYHLEVPLSSSWLAMNTKTNEQITS